MTQNIIRLNPSALPDASQMGYSQITTVEPGKMAFISGQVAWQPDGAPVPESLAEQAEIVVGNAKAALDSIGAGTEDIVMARLYVTDLTPERIEETMPILVNFFNGAQPSLTGIGVAALAGPDLQLEMEMTVRLSS